MNKAIDEIRRARKRILALEKAKGELDVALARAREAGVSWKDMMAETGLSIRGVDLAIKRGEAAIVAAAEQPAAEPNQPE